MSEWQDDIRLRLAGVLVEKLRAEVDGNDLDLARWYLSQIANLIPEAKETQP